MKKDSACPVCRSAFPQEFLRRENVPVHQNLVFPTQAEARRAARAALSMRVCAQCGFVFNAEFDAARLSYGTDYDNTQDCSTAFEHHLEALARRLVEHHGIRNARIVEVGCGKGSFLKRLVSYPGANNTGVGYDPSHVGPQSEFGGRLRFHREYYGPGAAHAVADVVVCRHVIEHVPDPMALLDAVGSAIKPARDPLVFFETPCVEWIFRNQVIWDFFYEHCSLFSKNTLAAAFRAAGFRVNATDHVFGGQYLWLEAGGASGARESSWASGDVPALAGAFSESEARLRARWSDTVRGLARDGRVALWGAGAKGATFANLVDPDAALIDCVVDLNPAKQGKFIPGSGHPIVSHRELGDRGVLSAILMNPNYREENAALLRSAGLATQLIELT